MDQLRRRLPGGRAATAVAAVSFALCAAAAAALLGGDWTATCPETHAVGWMDCGGQPDARWRAEALPAWVDIEHLFAAGVAGLAGLVVAAGVAVSRSR
jgi:hypothetical protein